MIGIAVVGYGYWGPNLARNFAAQDDCRIDAICEPRPDRVQAARRHHPAAFMTADYAAVLGRPSVGAVVIATPVETHFDFARRAILAGKDVLLEKPLTRTAAEARELISLARERGRILAVDHTFLFTGAVRKIKEIVDSGELGRLLYVDSVRINLGLFQNHANVLYDLAPHDLSILNHLVPGDPVAVQANAACHAGNGIENMAYLHLEFAGGFIAHFHFNWLAPVKIRRTLIGGSRKMLVYDDMEASEKVKVYDSGITLTGDEEALYKIKVDYRTGDMIAPKIAQEEALHELAAHFLECVRDRRAPIADGLAGLRVVRILEAAQTSIKNGGSRVALEPAEAYLEPAS